MSVSKSMRYDVVVVGGGVMGLSTAWQLMEHAPGLRVLLVEQFSLPHSRGSSHGHSRIIRSVYPHGSHYLRMTPRAFELWRCLEKEHQMELVRLVRINDAFVKILRKWSNS